MTNKNRSKKPDDSATGKAIRESGLKPDVTKSNSKPSKPRPPATPRSQEGTRAHLAEDGPVTRMTAADDSTRKRIGNSDAKKESSETTKEK